MNERSIHSDVLHRQQEARIAVAEAARSRRDAGMGFWRLVWIVALGILMAQAIAGVMVAVFRILAR